MAIKESPLVDQFGHRMSAATYYGGGFYGGRVYRTPTTVRVEDRPRQRTYLSPEMNRNLTHYDRRELIDAARTLKALPLIGGAVRLKALWACGDWGVKFIGENTAWGEMMIEELNNVAFKFCNPNHENYPFQQMLKSASEAQDTDGAQLNIWIRYGQNEFPMVRVVEATMISTGMIGYGTAGGYGVGYEGQNGRTIVKGGPYDGAIIQDGIIFDRDCRRVATRVWGFDDVGNMSFTDVPAEFSQMLFEPSWANGITAAPRLAASVVDLMRASDIKDWLTTAIGIASRLAIKRTTEDGVPGGAERTEINEPAAGGEAEAAAANQVMTTFEQLAAGVYELKSGEALDQLPFERPSMQEREFIRNIHQECLFSIGCPIELFDPAAMGRAGARSVKEIFRQNIWERQQTLERMTFGFLRWYISKRIANGDIPPNNVRGGADAYMWKIVLPAEYTVDEGNDRAADINDIKMGITTRAAVVGKRGESIEAIDAESFKEIQRRAQQAAKLAAEFPDKKFSEWLDFLEQRGPNLMAAPGAKQAPPAPAVPPPAT